MHLQRGNENCIARRSFGFVVCARSETSDLLPVYVEWMYDSNLEAYEWIKHQGSSWIARDCVETRKPHPLTSVARGRIALRFQGKIGDESGKTF
jgi:hypothetical protein